MSNDTITKLPDPSGFGSDPFTAVLRDGARKLIEQAIHAELAALMTAFAAEKLLWLPPALLHKSHEGFIS